MTGIISLKQINGSKASALCQERLDASILSLDACMHACVHACIFQICTSNRPIVYCDNFNQGGYRVFVVEMCFRTLTNFFSQIFLS